MSDNKNDNEVLYTIPVTPSWLDQFILVLNLSGQSSYRVSVFPNWPVPCGYKEQYSEAITAWFKSTEHFSKKYMVI